MSQSTSQGSENIRETQPHEKYYLNGGDLYFLVEHRYFRVHRYFFERESEFFGERLKAPAPPGGSRQGSSDSSAIILDDMLSSEFALFLWVFYNPQFSVYDVPVKDWMTILDLAHRWSFPEVKRLVIRELEKLEMSDIDRIVAYHKYEVDKELLVPRYAALCAREEPLTLKEGLQLGLETALMLARAREYARSMRTESGARSPSPATIEFDELHTIVKEHFIMPSGSSTDQDKDNITSGGSDKMVGHPTEQQQAAEPVLQLPTPTPTPPPMEIIPQIQPTAAETEGVSGHESEEKGGFRDAGGGEGTKGCEVDGGGATVVNVGDSAEDTKEGEAGDVGASGACNDQDNGQTDQKNTQGVDDLVNTTRYESDANKTDGETGTATTQNRHVTSIHVDGVDESTEELNENGDAGGRGEIEEAIKMPKRNAVSQIPQDNVGERAMELKENGDAGGHEEAVKTTGGNTMSSMPHDESMEGLNGNGGTDGSHGRTEGDIKAPNGNTMSPIPQKNIDERTKELSENDGTGGQGGMDEATNTPNGNTVPPNPQDNTDEQTEESNGNGDAGNTGEMDGDTSTVKIPNGNTTGPNADNSNASDSMGILNGHAGDENRHDGADVGKHGSHVNVDLTDDDDEEEVYYDSPEEPLYPYWNFGVFPG